MLEEEVLPKPLQSGQRRKVYWITTRGIGGFSTVLLFHYLLPVLSRLLGYSALSSNNHLLATSIFTSALLTFALIAVYRDLGVTQAQQADIMDSQRDLRRRQLNREVRQKHTEVLRHRIEEWLGQTPATKIWESVDSTHQNTLPLVKATGIESAAKTFRVLGEEEDLHAAPEWLKGERYFVDLLENHATDLNDLKEEIEHLQARFAEHHDSFKSKVEQGQTKEFAGYTIKPAYNFSEWVFEQIVLIERGFESQEELMERASTVVEVASMGREDSAIYPGEDFRGSPVGVLEVVAEDGDREILSEQRDEIENELVSLLRQEIKNIDEVEPYDDARRAAKILDDLEKLVTELRFKLTEYQGLPLYSGKCEYLEDELIE